MAGFGILKRVIKVFPSFWQGYWMGLSSLNGEKSFSSGRDGTDLSCILCSYSQSPAHNKRQKHKRPIWFYKYISGSYQ
jgi:hypothetical protein